MGFFGEGVLRNITGNTTSAIGTALHLPEFGISESMKKQSAPSYVSPMLGAQSNMGYTSFTTNPSKGYVAPTGQGGQQGNQAPDSGPITSNGGYGTSGGGGSVIDPADIWASQDALNQANWYLGQIDPQRQIFLKNLTSTYNNYRTDLANDKTTYEGKYNSSKNTANQNRVSSNNKIDSKVRQRANSLQRLMGAYGAGDSEAAQMYAPYAAARTGTQLRNEVSQQYGQTIKELTDNWDTYVGEYDKAVTRLNDEEKTTKDAKLAEFLTKQAELTSQKAQAEAALHYSKTGDAARAKQIRDAALPTMYNLLLQAQALGKQTITPTAQKAQYVDRPVEDFTVSDPGAIQGVQPSMAYSTSPYYQFLLKQRENDNNFFGY